MRNDGHNIKPKVELTLVTSVELTDEEIGMLINVAVTLSGVRMDLEIQEILDIVVELYNTDHAFDEIGLSVLGAMKMPAEQGVH